MIPTEKECNEIIAKFKTEKINIEESIKNTVKTDLIGKNYYVATNDGYPLYESIPEIELCSTDYFNYINDILNGKADYYDGIYIAICFASPMAYDGDAIEDEKIVGVGLDTYKDHVDIKLSEKDDVGDEESDFGIFVSKKEQYFCWKGDLGGHYGCTRLMNINEYLDEPLHRIAIKLIYDAVIFE